MSKERQDKRNKIKPFIKVINYNHLMPTRYTLELEGLKGVVSTDTFKEVSQREDAKKTVKKVFEERYTSGKNRWFFTPLSTLLPGLPSLCGGGVELFRRQWTIANVLFSLQDSKRFLYPGSGELGWLVKTASEWHLRTSVFTGSMQTTKTLT